MAGKPKTNASQAQTQNIVELALRADQRGHGGEVHQTARGADDALTTNQGLVVGASQQHRIWGRELSLHEEGT